MFKPGSSGNPAGRPRNAITNALRRMVDPEEMAKYLITIAKSPGTSARDRLTAIGLIFDRCEGKAIATVQMNATPTLPPGWNAMSPAERIALLDRIELNALAPATTPLDHLLDDGDDEDEPELKDANP